LIAVYPGSFDPVTSGHLDIIKRSAQLYDRVIVLVATNSSKKPLFTVEERQKFLETSCEGLTNISFDVLQDGLLVEYAQSVGARAIVKGLRAVSDFEYEFQMALLNRKLAPEIETVFLMTIPISLRVSLRKSRASAETSPASCLKSCTRS